MSTPEFLHIYRDLIEQNVNISLDCLLEIEIF